MGVFSHNSASQQHPGLKDRPQMLSMPEADFVTGFNVVWHSQDTELRKHVRWSNWHDGWETGKLMSYIFVNLQ